VRAGDDRAFELLYLRYHARIAAYVRGMVRDHGRAEDVTQEVFFSALRRMRQTEREIAFKPWIYEIAKNACIDAFRRSRHANEISFDEHGASGDGGRLVDMRAAPDAAVDAKLDLDNLCGAFGGLSDVHHQILVMREFEGLSYGDIGERLGMSRAAVESTLFRARRRLGEEFDELVSGRRCVRVRGIIDAGGRAIGLRDRHRLDRHLSHCQPCRRHAMLAGMDIDWRRKPGTVAAKIASLLPIPLLWRRRGDQEDATGHVLGQSQSSVAHMSASIAGSVDPGVVVNWSKALVAAATLAVAGVGAGTAITHRSGPNGSAGGAVERSSDGRPVTHGKPGAARPAGHGNRSFSSTSGRPGAVVDSKRGASDDRSGAPGGGAAGGSDKPSAGAGSSKGSTRPGSAGGASGAARPGASPAPDISKAAEAVAPLLGAGGGGEDPADGGAGGVGGTVGTVKDTAPGVVTGAAGSAASSAGNAASSAGGAASSAGGAAATATQAVHGATSTIKGTVAATHPGS
jgi:RNA polymerase sigma factor (sigma-70 family)